MIAVPLMLQPLHNQIFKEHNLRMLPHAARTASAYCNRQLSRHKRAILHTRSINRPTPMNIREGF